MSIPPPSYGQLQVVLDSALAEPFCDWLRETFDREPVSLAPPHHPTSVVDLYFDTLADAQAALRLLPSAPFPLASARAFLCDASRWTDFWRRHFRVTEVGKRLRTVPVWETPPPSDRIDILIDPGLSFGTGAHFTTRFCLEALEYSAGNLRPAPASLLDAGTGSGILSIAALRLGFTDIDAFDYDPSCIEKSAENLALNSVPPDAIRFFHADVLSFRPARRYDVVCANILSSVLIEAATTLWSATARHLIVSGIRAYEGDAVSEVFCGRGAREILRDDDGEWCGLLFSR